MVDGKLCKDKQSIANSFNIHFTQTVSRLYLASGSVYGVVRDVMTNLFLVV